MRVGAHASIAGGFVNAVRAQVDYGGNCGQLFTHAPVVWDEPTVDAAAATRFRAATDESDIAPWLIHAAYLVNLASPDETLRSRSIQSLQAELAAAEALDIEYVNVHLGAHTGAGVGAGLDAAIASLEALDVPPGVKLLVETDAGAGTKLGGRFDHLSTVVEECTLPLGVCLDTAHCWAAGYDLATRQAVAETIEAFDATVGIDRLACVHLNDSKHPRGTGRDEHAHIGEGEIGLEGLRAVVTHPALTDLPFIVETPTEGGRSFAWNIERVKGFQAD